MIAKNILVSGLRKATVRDARKDTNESPPLSTGSWIWWSVDNFFCVLLNMVRRLRADEDDFHLEIDMYSPGILITGRYEGSGGYNSLNISAHGTFVTNMSDLVYTWKLSGKPEVIDNEEFVRIKSFYMRPDVSNMQVNLTNESDDSKSLTDFGVKLVNENWRLLYRELLPIAQANWNKIGTKVANKLFLRVPYNKLFPL